MIKNERTQRIILTVWVVVSVVLIDQFTKYLAKMYLQPRRSISIIGNLFRLTYVENPGMAFGIHIGNRLAFNFLSILAVIIIFYYLFKLRNHTLLRVSFSLILGGAFGNLIDRFLRGRVIDFFDAEFIDIHFKGGKFLFFNLPAYSLDRWPVFNVADMAVSIGMIIILLTALFHGKVHSSVEDASQ